MPPPRKRKKIFVVGSLNKDLITRTSRIPAAGETLLATSFETGSGGKGANQAVACARLATGRRKGPQLKERCGADDDDDGKEKEEEEEEDEGETDPIVAMVGAVGSDAFGSELLTGLRSNGVDVSWVQERKGEQTGVANVLVDDETGENRILVSPDNANYAPLHPEFDRSLLDSAGNCSLLPDMIILQLEIPLETVCHVIQRAKEAHVPVLLNPAPAPAGGPPRSVYDGLTHLVLNESEAEILLRRCDVEDGVIRVQEEGAREGVREEEVKQEDIKQEKLQQQEVKQAQEEQEQAKQLNPASAAEHFLRMGVKNVVITLGSKGAYFATTPSESKPPGSSFQRGKKAISEAVNAVDTTGAGDTFVGAYAVRMCEEDQSAEIGEVVAWANRAAGKSVQRKGAQGGMPWRWEMDRR